ncbi:MAG: pyridoxamine 5'-phosphate oxidase family protein [Rhodospirillaceae bacterium]|nr:pyridoxamine 5'-phosphate oxidase family protein [Rhodospirillales bacterium]
MEDNFWRLIQDIPITMLTTQDTDGTLRSRPMVAHQQQFDGELWLFTRAGSHKAGEVQQNHQVNLSYAEPARQTYVSVSGWAELLRDGDKIRQLWSDALSKWFPRGPDDPDLALLCVRVEHAECWDTAASAMVRAYGTAKPGEHI